MEIQENKYRINSPQLKEKDKVQLYIKNFKTKQLSKKLNYIRVGLFCIKAIKGLINYKLKLPNNAKIFPIFYIFLLKKVSDKEPFIIELQYKPKEKSVYKVEKILEKKDN